jgi:hypothetical protein
MKMSRVTRCVAAWIAVFSILMAAFAPSLVHALSTGNNISSVTGEICSAAGPKLIKHDSVQKSGHPASGEIGSHLDHCPYCYGHGTAAQLPASYAVIVSASDASLSHPALYYQSPRPLFIWASAQSRAPPSQS